LDDGSVLSAGEADERLAGGGALRVVEASPESVPDRRTVRIGEDAEAEGRPVSDFSGTVGHQLDQTVHRCGISRVTAEAGERMRNGQVNVWVRVFDEAEDHRKAVIGSQPTTN